MFQQDHFTPKGKVLVTSSTPRRRFGVRVAAAATTVGVAAATLSLVTIAPAQAAVVNVQILGTNDFHGRLISEGTSGTSVAGAAQFAGAIEQKRADFAGDTIFAAAGDLVGASTFESFIQQDKPTLDAMNAMNLDVSAAGNHEFDGGYADLVNRIMKPFDAASNPNGGAMWQYLAANVRKKSDGSPALPDVTANTPNPADTSNGASWVTTTAGGAKIGFVGAVTEDLPSLVSPAGIADVNVAPVVASVNAEAQRLRSQENVDMVVMLIHEGATSTACTSMTDTSAFGKIVNGTIAGVDAIISGHTHLAYDCLVNGKPVVSSGQYGTNFNELNFTVDTDTNAVTLNSHAIVPANSVTLTNAAAIAKRDQVKTIVDAAVAKADVLGGVNLGQVSGGFSRAKLANGTENRGGESTLGNLVAEVQRWATSSTEAGAAQIAFMNPGGLRSDMLGTNTAGYPANLTYKQAASVQPFANTLVNMKLTGAQIKKVLEQQWQRDKDGKVPSRPFLRLGTSAGFQYTYDPARAEGDRVTGMWLNDKAIEAGTAYSVTVNSFLASGGDNFFEFANGTGKRDTGKVDLQAMVDYMKQYPVGKPLTVDAKQHSVAVTWPAGAPKFYRIGENVKLALASLAMTGTGDPNDAELVVKSGTKTVGKVTVDNARGADVFDEYGKAAVDLKLARRVPVGKTTWTFTGSTTGTTFSLPVVVRKAKPTLKIVKKSPKKISRKQTLKFNVKVKAPGVKLFGKVAVFVGGKKYVRSLENGKAVVKIKANKIRKTGKKTVKVRYNGKPYAQRIKKTFKFTLTK